jgi:RNA methyltransferase, TrmH family
MEEITSIKHPFFVQARECRTLQGQRKHSSFLVEEDLVLDLLTSSYSVTAIFFSDKRWEKELPPSIPSYKINQGMMKKLYPTGKTPTLVALCQQKALSLESFATKKCLVALEALQDPGNVGTMLRTCEAFGIEGAIIITEDVTQMYNRVTVKSARGSFFRQDFCLTSLKDFLSFAKKHSFSILSTSPHGDTLCKTSLTPSAPHIIVFGNETSGISAKMEEHTDTLVTIPMVGKIESLNVSVAAGIVLYSLTQQ